MDLFVMFFKIISQLELWTQVAYGHPWLYYVYGLITVMVTRLRSKDAASAWYISS